MTACAWAELFRSRIGARSEPVANRVDGRAVLAFARAIGDRHLISAYADRDALPPGVPVPPTFAKSLDFGRIPGVELPAAGLLHAGQAYRFRRPLRVGDRVDGVTQLAEVHRREGREGPLLFLVLERTGHEPGGAPILTSRETLVLRGPLLDRPLPG